MPNPQFTKPWRGVPREQIRWNPSDGPLDGRGIYAAARGHVDCMEIVRDHAVVSAIPEVKVTHPQAKVTHEAAIGSVDSKQLETLMARGLDPIVRSI